MLAVRGGDVGKLGALFERYHRPLYDFLSRTTGDRTAAEDLVQDVFVRVLKYRQTYRDDGCFETWVFRIARNARADYFKGRQPATEPADDLELPAPGLGPAQELERERDHRKLTRALLRLREEDRELLVLARYRNMKYERIGALLGIEVGAVKVRVYRAMKALRQVFLQLADEDERCVAKKSGTGWRTI
jgi:RNA polymerase sigma-70 factor (ECF subfamily)